MQGENAWVFAKEESVGACVKAFLEFEKNLKGKLPREERAKAKPTDISGDLIYPKPSKVMCQDNTADV